jgi:hypothetical protein
MVERKRLSDILPRADRDNLARAWDATAAASDLGPLPAGEYSCRLVNGELFNAKSGTPGYKITFEIVDGDYAHRRIWHDLWLSPAALAIAKRDLLKIGITHPDQLERPLPSGILAMVKLALRRGDDGAEFNRVVRFDPTGVEPDEPEPFAPSPNGEPAEPGDTLDQQGFDWGSGEQQDPPALGRGRGAYSKP